MVLVVRVWSFAILTTLYGDLGVYTCMTSWIESSPCVSTGHMFKGRTFWIFLCIISRPMLTCILCRCMDQVPRDLVILYGAWLLCLALWMPSRDVKEAKISVHEGVKAYSQVYGNSALGLRYARLSRKFIRVMQTKIEWEQCSFGRNNFRKKDIREELLQKALGVE